MALTKHAHYIKIIGDPKNVQKCKKELDDHLNELLTDKEPFVYGIFNNSVVSLNTKYAHNEISTDDEMIKVEYSTDPADGIRCEHFFKGYMDMLPDGISLIISCYINTPEKYSNLLLEGAPIREQAVFILDNQEAYAHIMFQAGSNIPTSFENSQLIRQWEKYNFSKKAHIYFNESHV